MKIAIIKLLTKTAIRLYRIADRMLRKELCKRYRPRNRGYNIMLTKQILNRIYGGENNVNNKRCNSGDSTTKGCTRDVDTNRC